MGRIKYLVIHCSDTPETMNVTGEMIRQWHTYPPPQGRGWSKPGYSDLIKRNGTIDKLNTYDSDQWITSAEVTNGAMGYNGVSVHICLAGGKTNKQQLPEQLFTQAQIQTLTIYLRDFVRRFPWVKICGHYQLNSGKLCPGFNVPNFLKSIYISQTNIK
jgi:hypothetical protein